MPKTLGDRNDRDESNEYECAEGKAELKGREWTMTDQQGKQEANKSWQAAHLKEPIES